VELTPSFLLDEVEFRETFRGYDRNQVDSFLEELAAALGALQSRIAAAEERARAAERRIGDAGSGQPARTLLLAQRAADATLREAREEAARLVREASTTVDRDRNEARTVLRAEIEALEAARQDRTEEIAQLDERIEAQRARLRALADAVQRLLAEPPEPAPVGRSAARASARADAPGPAPAAAPAPTAAEPPVPVADRPEPVAGRPAKASATDEPALRLDLRRVGEEADQAPLATPDERGAEVDDEVIDLRVPWEEVPPSAPPGRPRRFGRPRDR
jgi:cell division initiation protein